MSPKSLLDQLWQCYYNMNSQVPKIHKALKDYGEHEILNDHIAFRTFEGSDLGIDVMRQQFEDLGWQVLGSYTFTQKKLRAVHLEHQQDTTLPKIFLSELITSKFSENLQQIVASELLLVPQEFKSGLWLTKGRWQESKPCLQKYEQLLAESEYAAWLYIFGICPNHFTVYVNSLKMFDGIDALNEFLLGQGFIMNSAGGLVKGSSLDGLRQSSTMAAKVTIEFLGGEQQEIPCCYYEFAERFELNGTLFQGFVTDSADKIFQSTDNSS